MRIAAAAAIACTLATGCVHGQARYGAYAGEVAIAGLGALIIGAAPDAPPAEDDYGPLPTARELAHGLGGVLIASAGALFLVTMITNAGETERDEPRHAPIDSTDLPPVVNVPSAAPQAVRLTQQARSAAVAGLCDAVRALEPKVAAADGSYYEGVFRVDPAISTCL